MKKINDKHLALINGGNDTPTYQTVLRKMYVAINKALGVKPKGDYKVKVDGPSGGIRG